MRFCTINLNKSQIQIHYLTHDTVRSRSLLILEENLRVVVHHESLEPGVCPRDLSLREPARSQALLGHVGDVLLVYEGGSLAGPASYPVPAPGAAGQGEGGQEKEEKEQEGQAAAGRATGRIGGDGHCGMGDVRDGSMQ